MFGTQSLFDDSVAMTDAWNNQFVLPGTVNAIPANTTRSRFPDYVPTTSMVARTLPIGAPPRSVGNEPKRAPAATTAHTHTTAATASSKDRDERRPKPEAASPATAPLDYCDSYPNTNTTQVDWALFAAHRVASVCNIDLHQEKRLSGTQQKNMAVIFHGQCNSGERFKNDQRGEMLKRITLQCILLCIYLPNELSTYLSSVAAQHVSLRLASRQCSSQIEHFQAQLNERAARERDLLIKRILFHADNAQTECTLTLDYGVELGCTGQWSDCTLESVAEPDLFGRAIGVLVHQVLQSASLRVRSAPAAAASDKAKIVLTLSWKAALDNLRKAHVTAADDRIEATEKEVRSSNKDAEDKDAAEKRREAARQKQKPRDEPVAPVVVARARYMPNPLFDNDEHSTTGATSEENTAFF
jgi:hypothetical protein